MKSNDLLKITLLMSLLTNFSLMYDLNQKSGEVQEQLNQLNRAELIAVYNGLMKPIDKNGTLTHTTARKEGNMLSKIKKLNDIISTPTKVAGVATIGFGILWIYEANKVSGAGGATSAPEEIIESATEALDDVQQTLVESAEVSVTEF